MKILITAFDPFGKDSQNSAHLAMDVLPDVIAEHTIIKATLPVVYYKSIDKLKQLIDEHNPDAVICLGQAAGATGIRIERVAVNIDDTDADDNEGNRHIDHTIIKGAQDAYFATLPTREMMESAKVVDIPAHLSYTAGNYVCNHTMFGLLNYIDGTDVIGGFIHIPSTPQQVKDKKHVASMSSQNAAKGLTAMITIL